MVSMFSWNILSYNGFNESDKVFFRPCFVGNNHNNINTNNIDNNMFGGFKNSANDKTSKQAITTFDIDKIAKSRTNRQTVSEIKSPEADYTNYFESRRVA